MSKGNLTPAKLVFGTNFTSKAQVIALAKALGGDCIVIKHVNRANFNITRHARCDRWAIPGITVVWWPARFGSLPTAQPPLKGTTKE